MNSEDIRHRLQRLQKRARLYEQLKQTEGLDDEQSEVYLGDLKEIARLRRVIRAETDTLYFMYEYFSDDRNPENDQNLIPAGTSIAKAPDFHRQLCNENRQQDALNFYLTGGERSNLLYSIM